VHSQEQERLRLAHELHDQTGQSIAGVMLEIKDIENSAKGIDRERFRTLRLQLEQVGQALHRVAWELRPASIDELGLETALANYVMEWSAQYGIAVDFHCGDPGIDRLSDEICTTIYRVVQEALTNIVKHARQATSVSVVIARSAELLQLTIEDDGCGFDPNSLAAPSGGLNGGLGLAGMRERLTLIGAEFEIESSVDTGTAIFARVPVGVERTVA
jgi:two-component system, NarL family, sensor histidine kinase UhpB